MAGFGADVGGDGIDGGGECAAALDGGAPDFVFFGQPLGGFLQSLILRG